MKYKQQLYPLTKPSDFCNRDTICFLGSGDHIFKYYLEYLPASNS